VLRNKKQAECLSCGAVHELENLPNEEPIIEPA
jgi:hypothetical protein